ncbi:MAG: hypothetical protein PHD82_10600, partial [Candidatus Riflebacteria bacterium]|nr:hypothetical protein [Candidatus Riflebacteria bacterium]
MRFFATIFLLMLFPVVAVLAAPAKPSSGSKVPRAAKAAKTVKADKPVKPVVEDALWVEAKAAVDSGNASESVKLLRLCLVGRVNEIDAERLLRVYLASQSASIVNARPVSGLSESELQELLLVQKEICEFRSSTSDDWARLLEIAKSFKGDQQFIVAGEALLNKIQAGLPIKIDDAWVSRFKDLEKLLRKNTQVLYRLQVIEILAATEAGAKEFRPLLEDMRILAKANAGRILGQADVAMALGDLDSARRHIDRVKEFDPQYPGLELSYQRLGKATAIDRLVGRASTAMRDRLFLEAKRLCGEIQKLDPNNAFARNTIEEIERISARGPTARVNSAEAKVTLAIRRLETDLRKAEQEQDALQIRAILKELLLLKSDEPRWIERLAEIENQIAVSAMDAEEIFKQAQILFNDGRYAELKLLLNRSPGLMNSVDTMVQTWEMRLMANYHTGHLEPAELRTSAEAVIARAGQSLYGSFVLMKLDIAENRIDAARVHYQNAVKINPSYPGLRWPGWLLWAHGDGRPVVVVALIVIFFLMIQLLRPAFALYESTYWLRVGLMAKIFPSLALRSLEGCFGIYRDSGDRVKLFRLLVKCSLAVKNKKKAAMYASNLQELVPNDPLARAGGAAPTAKAGGINQKADETLPVEEPAGSQPDEMPPFYEEPPAVQPLSPVPMGKISMPKRSGAARKAAGPEPEEEPTSDVYAEPAETSHDEWQEPLPPEQEPLSQGFSGPVADEPFTDQSNEYYPDQYDIPPVDQAQATPEGYSETDEGYPEPEISEPAFAPVSNEESDWELVPDSAQLSYAESGAPEPQSENLVDDQRYSGEDAAEEAQEAQDGDIFNDLFVSEPRNIDPESPVALVDEYPANALDSDNGDNATAANTFEENSFGTASDEVREWPENTSSDALATDYDDYETDQAPVAENLIVAGTEGIDNVYIGSGGVEGDEEASAADEKMAADEGADFEEFRAFVKRQEAEESEWCDDTKEVGGEESLFDDDIADIDDSDNDNDEEEDFAVAGPVTPLAGTNLDYDEYEVPASGNDAGAGAAKPAADASDSEEGSDEQSYF